jgi:hypothetical protein
MSCAFFFEEGTQSKVIAINDIHIWHDIFERPFLFLGVVIVLQF